MTLPESTAMAGEISATASRKSPEQAPPPLPPEALVRLSWSHIVELLRLDDPWKRAFYENETLRASWSLREMQRQEARGPPTSPGTRRSSSRFCRGAASGACARAECEGRE